jgi:hypothetical protein
MEGSFFLPRLRGRDRTKCGGRGDGVRPLRLASLATPQLAGEDDISLDNLIRAQQER